MVKVQLEGIRILYKSIKRITKVRKLPLGSKKKSKK
jgi:hypothetical protein